MDEVAFHHFARHLPPAGTVDAGHDEVLPGTAQLQAILAAYVAEQDRRLHLPMVHAQRPPFRLDWISAWKHYRILGRDKNLTHEAFAVFDALPWVGVAAAARRFLATSQGHAIYFAEPSLPEVLDDHAALRRLPKGSFGQAYCDSMERDGLSAAGLVAAYEKCQSGAPKYDDKLEWYLDRLRDTHDFHHILTGFGRDVLGEQCVLAYVFHQRPSIGHLFTGYAGAALTRLHSSWKIPVLRAVFEARQIGKHSLPIVEQPIRELLAMPLEDVRKRLGLRPARHYHEAMRIWREVGIDPNGVLAKAAVA